MEYVLIWVIFFHGYSSGAGTASQEFDNLAACERGKIVIENSFKSSAGITEIKAVCLPKK